METSEARFRIVFRKLDEALGETDSALARPAADVSREELDELEELRRIVIEVVEPPIASYTLT